MTIKTGLNLYKDLYDAYYGNHDLKHKMPYAEFRQKADVLVQEFVDELLTDADWDTIRKQWFIDYGCHNCWDADAYFKHSVATELHDIDAKNHPELHKQVSPVHFGNCIHEMRCSCGFSSWYDSGD